MVFLTMLWSLAACSGCGGDAEPVAVETPVEPDVAVAETTVATEASSGDIISTDVVTPVVPPVASTTETAATPAATSTPAH